MASVIYYHLFSNLFRNEIQGIHLLACLFNFAGIFKTYLIIFFIMFIFYLFAIVFPVFIFHAFIRQ